jgi:hypothetical protein
MWMMLAFMTVGTKSNQIKVVVVALLTAEFLVMDLQVLPRTTNLASPAIATQDLFSELAV